LADSYVSVRPLQAPLDAAAKAKDGRDGLPLMFSLLAFLSALWGACMQTGLRLFWTPALPSTSGAQALLLRAQAMHWLTSVGCLHYRQQLIGAPSGCFGLSSLRGLLQMWRLSRILIFVRMVPCRASAAHAGAL